MPTYTPEESKAIAEAKKNPDINVCNDQIVRIIAASEGVPNEKLIFLERDADGRAVQRTDEGTFYLHCHSKGPKDLMARYGCSESGCKAAFKCLPVDGKDFGYFVNDHTHPAHINPALVRTFYQLLAAIDEKNTRELARFDDSHGKVQEMMGKPGRNDVKHLNYAVISPDVDEETFQAMDLKSRFEKIRYIGETGDELAKRMNGHAKANNLFPFTDGGANPKFLVVCSKRDMSAGEAAQKETRLISLAGSDHRILNADQGAKWRKFDGVTLGDGDRATSRWMVKLLSGDIYPFDWTKNIERNKDRKPPPPLELDAQEGESPAVGRKRKRDSSRTPTSALGQLHFSPAPGSAVIRTSTGVFTFDGTLEDLEAKQAELNHKVEEEKERLRQEGGTQKRPA